MVIQPGGDSGGGTVGTSATSPAAIPALANGANPKWVYIAITLDSGVSITLTFGGSGVATPTLIAGIGLSAHGGGIIVNVAGCSHWRAISTDADTTITITPLAGISTRA